MRRDAVFGRAFKPIDDDCVYAQAKRCKAMRLFHGTEGGGGESLFGQLARWKFLLAAPNIGRKKAALFRRCSHGAVVP